MSGRIAGVDFMGATVSSAQALSERLRSRLDKPVSREEKRRLIEFLAAGVRVDSAEERGVKQTTTTVRGGRVYNRL